MEQIAKEADVAKGTLYNHFPAKEALLVHHFHGELAAAGPQLQAAIQAYPDFAGRMRCLLHASADWSAAHRTYLGPYLRFRLSTYDFAPAGNLYSRSGLDRVFEALIRAGQQVGELRSYSTPAKLARQFQFLYLGALMSWLSQEDCDLHLEFDAALDVFLHGLMVTTTKGTK
jgi:AcrR family transcriptional regulator